MFFNWLRKKLRVPDEPLKIEYQCEHKWKVFERIEVYEQGISMKIPNRYKIVLQCEKCGDMKVIKT